MTLRGLIAKGSWILLVPLVTLMYGPLNHDNGNVHILVTYLDRSIPFSRFFVVPYVAWYGLIFVVLVWYMRINHRLYFSALISIILGLLASFATFSVFQTTVPRPVIPGQDAFSQLTRIIYRLDNSYNAFPSIHVMTSYIIFLGSERAKAHSRKIPLLIQGSVVLIILSTLFLKQHTLLDVTGGIILGGTLFKTTEAILGLINKGNITSARYTTNINVQKRNVLDLTGTLPKLSSGDRKGQYVS
ncbi:MAG: phosphatase PAP2 family protein [Firmicutes bacterium]|nr:phosphatase PAP2 family protein [Bacillota bacterium]